MHFATGRTGVLRKRAGRLALLAALATVAAAAPAGVAVAKPTPTPEQKAAALVLPAVVYIEVHWQGFVRDKTTGMLLDPASVSVVSRCSGFAVTNDGYIVTAGQCVDPGLEGVAPEIFQQIADRRRAAGLITQAQEPTTVAELMAGATITGPNAGEPAARQVFAQRGVAKAGLTSGDALPAEVVNFEPISAGDVGIIKIEKSNQPVVTLGDSSDLKVGTDVFTVAYGDVSDGTSDNTLQPADEVGKINAKRTAGDVPFYQTSLPTTRGMNGGPVADLNGDIVGLVAPGPGTDQVTYNALTTSSLISDALTKAGVKNQLGKIDKDYRGGLDDFYAGRYTSAIEKFDQVLAAVPSQAQAQDYRAQAVSLRTSDGDPSTVVDESLLTRYGSTMLIVAAVLVLLLAFVLRLRKRGRIAPVGPVAPVAKASESAPATGTAATAVVAPTKPPLAYCTNCSAGSPPDTAACATCGKQFS